MVTAQVAGYEVAVQILLNEQAKAKASGILVVVGVGTYIAYRLCVKYLGPDFISDLLAQLHPQPLKQPSTADKFQPQQYDILADDEWSDTEEEETSSSRATTSTFLANSPQAARKRLPSSKNSTPEHHCIKSFHRHGSSTQQSPFRRHHSFSPFSRLKSGHEPDLRRTLTEGRLRTSICNSPVVTADSSSDDDCWNDNSPPPMRKAKRPKALPIDTPSNSGTTGFQLLWDQVCTPDIGSEEIARLQHLLDRSSPETNRQLLQTLLGRASPAPSEFSEISVAANIQIGTDTAENLTKLQGDISEIKVEVDDLNLDISDLLHRSLADTKTYYQSVMLAPSDLSSEIGSVTSMDVMGLHSGHISSPIVETRKEKKATLPVLPSPILSKMIRSADSYETHLSMDRSTSSEDGLGQKISPLVDSAIWTDSDGELNSAESNWLSRSRSFGPSLGVTPEEEGMEEQVSEAEEHKRSPSVSEFSMEWEEMKAGMSYSPNMGETNTQQGSWNSLATTGQSFQPLERLPPGTRDLKILARDIINPCASKVLVQLHKRCRLQKALEIDSHPGAVVFAILHCLAHQASPIFKCNSFKAVQLSLKRCKFLHRWPMQWSIASEMHLASSSGKSVEIYILRCLKALWHFNNLYQNPNGYSPEGVSHILNDHKQKEKILEAIKILMVLKMLEAYEETLLTREISKAFYSDLFRFHTPKQLIERYADLGSQRSFSSIELALLADALEIRLEIFELESDRPQVAAVYPEKSGRKQVSVTILRSEPERFLPLFFTP